MRKADTAKRKAASRRNRHNGRINAYKKHVLEQGKSFVDGNKKPYTALIKQQWIQDTMAFLKDSDGSVTDMIDTTKGWWNVTSTIVRGNV